MLARRQAALNQLLCIASCFEHRKRIAARKSDFILGTIRSNGGAPQPIGMRSELGADHCQTHQSSVRRARWHRRLIDSHCDQPPSSQKQATTNGIAAMRDSVRILAVFSM